jgi:hypothetical protein
MTHHDTRPEGSLEPEKRGPSSEPGHPQPTAPEVESARLLANESAGQLEPLGFTRDRIRQLADEFVARDLGEGIPEFVAWAKDRGIRHSH